MSRPKFKIKKDDLVQVISGSEKGKRGKVLKVLTKESKVLVENVNMVVRFAKPSATNPNGPFKKEMPIHISNVAVIDPSSDKPSKVAFKMDESNAKVRVARKSGTVL